MPQRAPDPISAAVQDAFPPGAAGDGSRRRHVRHWTRTLRWLRRLGGTTRGNALEVEFDGDRVFEAMWGEIERAERRVVLASYEVAPDRVGRRTIEALARAASRGADVELRYDAFGSSRLGRDDLAPLLEAGGRATPFNPLLRGRLWASPRLRDHRKVAVVDGRVGFCGGMNATEDYAGERFGNGLFRDTHLRVEGPAVRDLEDLLVQGELPRRTRMEEVGTGALVQVLESHRLRRRRAIQRALRYLLARATERCWFTTPYFLPPRRLRRAITGAARRGVDVRILTAGRSDVPIARIAAQHVYGHFLRSGVRIFEMREPVLHAKSATIDGVHALVGSFNLDFVSDRLNLEVLVAALDRPLAGRLDEQFERDLEGSDEVTALEWERRGVLPRLASGIVYRLARL